MLNLKATLAALGRTQSELAQAVGVSPATIAQVCNHNHWPKRPIKKALQDVICKTLAGYGASAATLDTVFETASETDATHNDAEDNDMLLRKQEFTPETMRHFGLLRDPFEPVRSSEEVYLTHDARVVRETMRRVARVGGFLAVIGESGAGKSTLRKDLINWIHREQQPVVVIQPYTQETEHTDKKGKQLKTAHIAEAILAKVAPFETQRRSPEGRFAQVHRALRESHRAGNRHLLIIEEAHSLPVPTLKHLKRIIELEADDGFSHLLGVILIGQTELGQTLDERNPTVREVVQRCGIVHLHPLNHDLEGYLAHRLGLANRPLEQVIDPAAVEALRSKLQGYSLDRSVLYPLAIHNVMIAAMNEAAALGVPRITAELVEGA